MSTRSRTLLYCKYRESLKTHRKISRTRTLEMKEFKPHKTLLAQQSDDEGSVVDARVYSVPPVWVTLVDDLNRDLASIQTKVSELQTISGKHLLPSFGEEEDQEEQITHIVQELTVLFKDSERRLKEVAGAKSEGSGDELVRKNIERRVAQQLQDLSMEFRRGHKTYLSKLKGQQIDDFRPDLQLRQQQADGASHGTFFDDEPSADPSCVDPRFSAQQTLQLVMAEHMTEERERAIVQVAENVSELAEIFKEIHVLVIDQGTILDRIDYNIEQAADRIMMGEKEIGKANEYQKKSRTMLCIYLLLLLCGAMVIVLIMKKSM